MSVLERATHYEQVTEEGLELLNELLRYPVNVKRVKVRLNKMYLKELIGEKADGGYTLTFIAPDYTPLFWQIDATVLGIQISLLRQRFVEFLESQLPDRKFDGIANYSSGLIVFTFTQREIKNEY